MDAATRNAPAASISSVAEEIPRGSLVAALEWLSQRHGLAFIAEGQPYLANAGDGPLRDVKLSPDMPLRDVIARIASAYDYRPEQIGKLILLHKKYTHPDDLPEVTGEELLAAYDRLVKLLTPLSQGFLTKAEDGTRPFFQHLLAQMTPEMLARMKRPAPLEPGLSRTLTPEQRMERIRQKRDFTGIPVSALSPEVRKVVETFAVGTFLSDAITVCQSAKTVSATLALPSSAFRHEVTGDGRFFGYSYDALGKPYFVPLSPLRRVYTDFASFVIDLAETMPVKDPIDDRPKPEDYESPGVPRPFHAEKPNATLTLEAFAQRWNGRKDRNMPLELASGLGGKRITLVGEDRATAAELLTPVQQIYGLRVSEEGNGSAARQTLTFPRPPRMRNYADTPAAIRSVLPRPIQKSLLDTVAPSLMVNQTPSFTASGINRETLGAMRVRLTRMKHEAIRRVRVIVEPKLTADAKEFPYSEFTPELKTLTTLLFTGDALPTLAAKAVSPLPPPLLAFDQSYIEGEVFGDTQSSGGWRKFIFHLRGPNNIELIGSENVGRLNPASP